MIRRPTRSTRTDTLFPYTTLFRSIELDAQQGITDEGDGANFNISATVGTNFADGRGNIVLSASYLDRKDIFPQTSRKFFREYQPLSLPNNGLALEIGRAHV